MPSTLDFLSGTLTFTEPSGLDPVSGLIAAARTGRPAAGLFVRHAPWGRRYPVVPGAGFHVVVDGSCVLAAAHTDPIPLRTGDVLFLPRGADHDLADAADSPITETAHPGEPRIVTGPGDRCILLCGAYELDRGRTHPLLAGIPEFVHLPATPERHRALNATVELLLAEITERRPGADAAIPALLDTMLLHILRAWLAEQAAAGRPAGWAAAFADPVVSAALHAIHAAPARPWTVTALGACAGVSRATMARRFTATVGEPPLAYVARWRLLTAAGMLRESDATLTAVARAVGYTSEFAFAKAFKRAYGTAPGRYRRRGIDFAGQGPVG
ncbi:AraC family transcriptional regulator [Nocardia sp. NPDC057353]|uniref:AraC family transcriptional regulator n=1 Tax=Nocardia sp. NPDC057353 TaxID=3346104 RepID=UPI0036266885